MKVLTALVSWLCCSLIPLCSQEPAGSPPASTSAPPVLEYVGKPLTLPFHCSDEDIQLAGLTCSLDEPCPIYLELSAAEAAGDRVVTVGNLHSPAVTLYSMLLASEDGGRTWSETAPRVRGAVLDRIQFLNPENGWVSGHSEFPLPHDPFLFTTTDGAKTWQSRPIFAEGAENHLGMIQQFSFTAMDRGSLIVDRGQGSSDDRWERYESPDGGASWHIQESSSKPLQLKESTAPSVDWRVRADAASKSFHIEHRQGMRWTTVAAFSVSVGVCRPEPEKQY